MRLDRFDVSAANQLLDDMSRDASAQAAAAAGGRWLGEMRQVFMRYAGQGHEIPVALRRVRLMLAIPNTCVLPLKPSTIANFARHIPGAAIEIMSWVVLVSTGEEQPPLLRRRGCAGGTEIERRAHGIRRALGRQSCCRLMRGWTSPTVFFIHGPP